MLDAWPKLAAEYRKKLISSLSNGNYHIQGRTPFPSNASQRVVFQELLLLALEDTTRYWVGDTGNVDPLRLCDIAGTELNKRWPEKFSFASKAGKLERNRQRITIINTSRREQGLAEIPLPIP